MEWRPEAYRGFFLIMLNKRSRIMKIFRIVATIEDACGENKEIDFVHEAATLDGAYKFVMTWIRAQLKPGFCLTNDTSDSVVAAYTIKPLNGPDYFCTCWIEEEVLYDYQEKEKEILFE